MKKRKRIVAVEALRRAYEFARELGLPEQEAIQAVADSYAIEGAEVLQALTAEEATA